MSPYMQGHNAALHDAAASWGQPSFSLGFPPRSGCPYPRGSEEADAWHRGYADARREMRSEAF